MVLVPGFCMTQTALELASTGSNPSCKISLHNSKQRLPLGGCPFRLHGWNPTCSTGIRTGMPLRYFIRNAAARFTKGASTTGRSSESADAAAAAAATAGKTDFKDVRAPGADETDAPSSGPATAGTAGSGPATAGTDVPDDDDVLAADVLVALADGSDGSGPSSLPRLADGADLLPALVDMTTAVHQLGTGEMAWDRLAETPQTTSSRRIVEIWAERHHSGQR